MLQICLNKSVQCNLRELSVILADTGLVGDVDDSADSVCGGTSGWCGVESSTKEYCLFITLLVEDDFYREIF